ncbi:LLM class flavin-dependent oxidoreductase, partial [Mycobacterium sp. NPDC003449]
VPPRVGSVEDQPGGPRIFLGGSSPAALARVGRRGDGWIGFDTIPEDSAKSLWSTARRAAEDSGRDPDALERIIRVNGVPDESLTQLGDRLARLAEQGVDEAQVDFVFMYPTIDERLDAAERLITISSSGKPH